MKSTNEKCLLCESESLSRENYRLCIKCYSKVLSIAQDKLMNGKKPSLTGIIYSLYRNSNNAKLLKIYDIPGDLLDTLKARAESEGITFRQLVINLFTRAVADMKGD